MHVTADEAMGLLTAPRDGVFAWHAVSRRVNHVANDDPQLVLPISEQELAAEAAASRKPVSRKPSPHRRPTTGRDRCSRFHPWRALQGWVSKGALAFTCDSPASTGG